MRTRILVAATVVLTAISTVAVVLLVRKSPTLTPGQNFAQRTAIFESMQGDVKNHLMLLMETPCVVPTVGIHALNIRPNNYTHGLDSKPLTAGSTTQVRQLAGAVSIK